MEAPIRQHHHEKTTMRLVLINHYPILLLRAPVIDIMTTFHLEAH